MKFRESSTIVLHIVSLMVLHFPRTTSAESCATVTVNLSQLDTHACLEAPCRDVNRAVDSAAKLRPTDIHS